MIKISSLLGMLGRKGEAFLNARPFRQDNEVFARLLEKCPPEVIDDRMCGIEVEVERCYFLQNADAIRYRAYDKILNEKLGVSLEELFGHFWFKTNDGSLRNHGIEYVTKLGTTFKFASSAVKALEKFFSIVEKDAQVNARTGLHVHVDARDLQLIDLQRLLLVYALFEEVLFNYSGARQNSVFCVPIGETDLPLAQLRGINSQEKLKNFVNGYCKKYTGLNLAPLATQGTIEFRMHKGSINAAEINKWLQIISDLVGSVTKQGRYQDFSELAGLIPNLVREDLYMHFFRSVFPKSYNYLLPFVTREAIESGVSTAKELLLDSSLVPNEYKLKSPKNKNRLDAWPRFDEPEDGIPELIPLRPGILDRLARFNADEDRVMSRAGILFSTRFSALGEEARNLIDEFLLSHIETYSSLMTDLEFISLPGEGDVRVGDRWWVITPFGNRYFIHVRSQVYCYNAATGRIEQHSATVTDEPNMYFLAVRTHGH